MTETVRIICTHAPGLTLHLHRADGPGETVTLQGNGAVTEVPAAFWRAWRALPANLGLIDGGQLHECANESVAAPGKRRKGDA